MPTEVTPQPTGRYARSTSPPPPVALLPVMLCIPCVTKIIRRHANASQRSASTSFYFDNIFGKDVTCAQYAVRSVPAVLTNRLGIPGGLLTSVNCRSNLLLQFALADLHLIAGVGRLDPGVDVAPVVARRAAGGVEGVAVVYVDEVVARLPIHLVCVVCVGVGMESVEVSPAADEIPLAIADPLVDGLSGTVAVTGYGVTLLGDGGTRRLRWAGRRDRSTALCERRPHRRE